MRIAIRRIAGASLFLILCGSASAADVSKALGFQIGAGAGVANIDVEDKPSNIVVDLKENHTAWKAFVGLRPISLFGAELSYFDFGKATATSGSGVSTVNASAAQKGTALFAVGYLPVTIVDIFAKAGIAKLQTDLDGSAPQLPCTGSNCNVFHRGTSDSEFAWGAGAQVRLPFTGLAIRLEFEQFKAANSNPNLVTLGLLWSP